MSKKKKIPIPEPISEYATIYLAHWIDLNNSYDELVIDEIRRNMNNLWSQMTKQDKHDFRRESERYELTKIKKPSR